MDVRRLVAPSLTRPRQDGGPKGLIAFLKGESASAQILKTNFSFSTIILLGAVLQTVWALLPLPVVYRLAPASVLLLARFAYNLLVSYGIVANPYLKNVIQKNTAVLLPDALGNQDKPGQEKIAILLLGVKCNDPLGIFAKGFSQLGEFAHNMNSELESGSVEESGFLGVSTWKHTDSNGNIEQIFISYWRSIEDVHRYAHGPYHKQAWKWWDSTLKEHGHIGIMHEVFEADAGMWEGVYNNFQPTLIGQTSFLKKGDKSVGGVVDDVWISPLVEAKGKLRTSNGRRGKLDTKDVRAMFENGSYT